MQTIYDTSDTSALNEKQYINAIKNAAGITLKNAIAGKQIWTAKK